MEARNIVAIEISSSKIKGGVARVDSSGSLTVLAIEEVKQLNSVRYGRIHNVQEVTAGVSEIIRKLENNPAVMPHKIVGVVLPLGGRSLGSLPATGTLNFLNDIEIMPENVMRLKQEAMKDVVTPKIIEGVVARTYYVDNMAVRNPVGTYGKTFKGDFVLIGISPENRLNLERVKIEGISSDRIFQRLRATAVGDLVLTDTERQLGCALVDFGAETTTVSVYKDGTLCFLSTLPLGSRLITRDLMNGLSLTEERAEEFKVNLGNAAMPEAGAANADATAVEVNNYVQARAGEIAANIVHQILQSGFKPSELPSGIILVGGGAHLRNFNAVLGAQSKMNVREGSIPPVIEFVSNSDRVSDNIDIVALLKAGAKSMKVEDCLYLPPQNTIVFEDPDKNEEEIGEEEEYTPVRPIDEKEDHKSLHTVSSPEPAQTPKRPKRHSVDYDDDKDLLSDDPDDKADIRNRAKITHEPDLEEDLEVEETKVNIKDPFEENEPNDTGRRKKRPFSKWQNIIEEAKLTFGSILSMPDEPQDDNLD